MRVVEEAGEEEGGENSYRIKLALSDLDDLYSEHSQNFL